MTGDENSRDELVVSGMGFTGKLASKEMLSTLIFALAMLGLSYVLYAQHDAQNMKFDAIIQQLAKANELQYLQTYTLSRPQSERIPIMPPAQLWKYLDRDTLKDREEMKRK